MGSVIIFFWFYFVPLVKQYIVLYYLLRILQKWKGIIGFFFFLTLNVIFYIFIILCRENLLNSDSKADVLADVNNLPVKYDPMLFFNYTTA